MGLLWCALMFVEKAAAPDGKVRGKIKVMHKPGRNSHCLRNRRLVQDCEVECCSEQFLALCCLVMATFLTGGTENLEAPSTPPRRTTPEPQEAVSPTKEDRVNSDLNMRMRHELKDGKWHQEPYKTLAQGFLVSQSMASSPIPASVSQIPFFSSCSQRIFPGNVPCVDNLNGQGNGSSTGKGPFSACRPYDSPLAKPELSQSSPVSLQEIKSRIPKPVSAHNTSSIDHSPCLRDSTDLDVCCTQRARLPQTDLIELRESSDTKWGDACNLAAKRGDQLRKSLNSGNRLPLTEKPTPFFNQSGEAMREMFEEERVSPQNESTLRKSSGVHCQSTDRSSNNEANSSCSGSSFHDSDDKENNQELDHTTVPSAVHHSDIVEEWTKTCTTRYPDDVLRMSEEDLKGIRELEYEEDLQTEDHELYRSISEICNARQIQQDLSTFEPSKKMSCDAKSITRESLFGGAASIVLLLSIGFYIMTRASVQPSKEGRVRLSEKFPSSTVCSPIAPLQYTCLLDPSELDAYRTRGTCETEAAKVLGIKKCPAFSYKKDSKPQSSPLDTFSFVSDQFLKFSDTIRIGLIFMISCTSVCLLWVLSGQQGRR